MDKSISPGSKEREKKKRRERERKEMLAKKNQSMNKMRMQLQLQQGGGGGKGAAGRNSIARSTQLNMLKQASNGGVVLGLSDPRYRPTIYKKKASSGETATQALDPSMQPFINRVRPERGSPRTATGLSRSNTNRVHRFLEAKKHAAAISKKDRPTASPALTRSNAKAAAVKELPAVITKPPAADLAKQSHLAKFLLQSPENQQAADGDGDEQDKAKARTSKLLKAGRIIHHQVSARMNEAAGIAAGVMMLHLLPLPPRKSRKACARLRQTCKGCASTRPNNPAPPFIVSSAAAHFIKRGLMQLTSQIMKQRWTTSKRQLLRPLIALNYGARGLAYAKLGMWLKAVRDFSTALEPKMPASELKSSSVNQLSRLPWLEMIHQLSEFQLIDP